MLSSRPENNTPQGVFEWFRTVNKETIFNLLKEYRRAGYSENLNNHDPMHIIFHALTTNNIGEVNVEKLKAAKEHLNTLLPIDDIIKLITLAIELIIKIIEASERCKPPAERSKAKLEFVELLKNNGEENPFINLPYMHLTAADLKEVNLKYANLENAKLKYVYLNHANLKFANLRDARLYETDIRGADISQADVRWADLSSCLSDMKADKLSLKSFLQTQCHRDICLHSVPTVAELNDTLNKIQTELECERLGGHEGKTSRALHQHGYHQQVGMNIARIAKQIKDPKQGYELMMAGAQHPYFAHHSSAKFAKGLDHAMVSLHKFFHHHVRQTPYFGSASQLVMLRAAKGFEEQIQRVAETANKPATP